MYMIVVDWVKEHTYPQRGVLRKQGNLHERTRDEWVLGVIGQSKVGRSNADNINSVVK
jgi:hypothetical protein